MAPNEPQQKPLHVRRADESAEVGEALERMDERLEAIRQLLDQQSRSRAHKEFSFGRPIAALTQALVIGLLAWAVSDWVFEASAERLLVKLGLAVVLQLIVISALLASPRER